MSWKVYLEHNNKPVPVEKHSEGGTYAIGGTDEAELNITYNYGNFYYHCLDRKEGLRWLNGKKAKDCTERLENAVRKLGTDRDKDYWAPTQRNAGYALSILLRWARQYPNAIFKVS